MAPCVMAGMVWTCAWARGAENPAAGRLRLEKTPDSPWPASAGVVEVWPSLASGGRYTVCTSDGKAVHSQIVWSAIDQPALVRFETSAGNASYYLTFDTDAPAPAGAWAPEAGVLLETRACQQQPVKTLQEVSRLAAASEPEGRSFVPNIFQGINPHGPSANYVALFTGWFRAGKEGAYEFATVSSGASSLEIDGRAVAQWLGRHDPHGGRRGEHGGRISLKPGTHRLDYLEVQFDGEPAAVAAWRPPGAAHFEVMPPSAFVPLARFHVADFQAAPGAPGQLYVEWENLEHCLLADSLLVKVRLRAVAGGKGRRYRWRFDDGDEAAGAAVEHIFPEAGTRQVMVQALEGQRCVATNSVRLRVRPNWLQREDWRQDLFEEAKRAFLARELARMPARDLSAALKLAERAGDIAFFTRLGRAMLKRPAEFNNVAAGSTFYNLGLGFQHQGDEGNGLAEQALQLALSPERASGARSGEAKLRIADLLVHCDGNLDAGGKLLSGLSPGGLAPEERRLARLLQGDLLLARGKVLEARQHYAGIGELFKGPGRGTGVARAAMLESAGILVERGDYDDAERALDLLVYEFPLERASLDVGLLRANLCLRRKEFRRAFELCRALASVPGRDADKAGLLGVMVEAALASGKRPEAHRALLELLKAFPGSEPAAKAKERWEAAGRR